MAEPLLANETVVMRFRKHPIVLVRLLFPAVATIILTVVVLALVPRTIGSTSVSEIEYLVALALILLALLACVPAIARWYFYVVTLTTSRIIESNGVFSREHDSLPVARIQAVKVHQRLLQRMLGCGDVEIESAGRDAVERLPYVPRANAFATAVESEMAGQPSSAPL